MREIGQPEVRPDRLGQIHDDVARVIPGREHAELRFALGPHRPVQEPDPRVPAARVRQHTQRRSGRSGGHLAGLDVKSLQCGVDRVRIEPGRGLNLGHREAVGADHVLEPDAKIVVVTRRASFGRSYPGRSHVRSNQTLAGHRRSRLRKKSRRGG